MTASRAAAVGADPDGTAHGSSPLGIAGVCLAVTLFGLGNVLIKRIPLSGVAVGMNRLWLGALLYLAILLARGIRPRLAWLRASWKGGLAYGTHIASGFAALKLTRVSDMTIIVSLSPALVLLLAGPLFGERVRRGAVVATGVAFAGVAVALLAGAEGGGTVLGDALAVVALLSWTAYFLWSKQARRHLGALEYQLPVTFLAALICTPIAFATEGTAALPGSWRTVGLCALVVLGPGSGHLLVNWAHAHVEVTLSSMLTLASPIAAAAGAALALGEDLLPVQVAGMAVALAALAYVVAAGGRPARDAAEEPPA